MIKLQPIFSDNALFLHSAPLTVRGVADISSVVTVTLTLNGAVITSSSATSLEDGLFEVMFNTPVASFDEYEITVCCGDEIVILHNVIFGELWLASGQSNMEMANQTQIESSEYLASLSGKKMRFFWQMRNPGGHSGTYPYEPDLFNIGGKWVVMDDLEFLKKVSACATAFSNFIYGYLNSNSNANIPVGFVNSSVGGTLIEPWLPKFAYENNSEIANYLKDMNRYPDITTWNARGEGNYQQTSCMFNQLIAPHFGTKFRGIIWYQGESNCTSEFNKRIYAKLLKALRESYKNIFAASEDEVFPIISSMIYPWAYGQDGECNIGYLNKAFSDLAKESPAEYPFIPICDLKPTWGFHFNNHPIHPLHKYPLGERMGLVCCNSLYGRKAKNLQKLPPMLKSCVRRGNALRLTFSDVGSGLSIKGKNLRGIYVCGLNGVYMPAKAEIVSKNALMVYAEGVKKPIHVAYAVSSYEAETNLYAGEFPVTPFGTQLEDRSKPINIQLKPWMNTELDSQFVIGKFNDTYREAFRQPIFIANDRCTVCYDPDFSLTGRSVRVSGVSADSLGCYVYARRYNALDLYNYATLNVSFTYLGVLTAKLVLHYAENNGTAITVTIVGEKLGEQSGRWSQYAFDLSSLPVGTITKMEFNFSLTETMLPYVCMDSFSLNEK